MTNKTITLSRELSDDEILEVMADHGTPNDIRETCTYNERQALAAGRALLRAALADPVPPAGGEPEAQRWHPQKTPIGTVMKPHVEGDFVRLEDHRAHVTRLQAEVERLKVHFDAMQLQRDHHRKRGSDLQSELTKARELLANNSAVTAHLLHALSVLRSHHLYGELPSVGAGVRDCLKLLGEPLPPKEW